MVYETTRIRQQLMLEERKRERQRQYREAQEQSVTSQEGKEPADNAGAGAPVQQEEELDLHPSDVIGQKELQLVKTIVRYGEIVMAYDEDENGEKKAYTVISYIQSELESDGLAFTHPVYARILREAVENQNQPDFTASRYFMQHPDSAISRLAAHLLSDRYQLSENFAREQRISSEAEKLNESVPIMLVDLKMAIVATQMKSILKSLQDPAVYNDAELYTEKMKQYQDLKEIQKALASAGGDRTITV